MAKYLGIDSSFGRINEFLGKVPQGLIYFVDIPCDHLVFLERPTMAVPEYSGKVGIPEKEVPSFLAIRVDSIPNNANFFWDYVVLGTGSNGPIVAKDKCLRVVNSHKGKPVEEVWLYIRELDDGSIKYALSNESADASPINICKQDLLCWSIEQSFKECKNNLSLDHYET
jgi:hypothetical protein